MVGVCSYLLVSFWFTRIAANQSSMAAFLTNRVGDCFLTIGMFALLWSFGKKTICEMSNIKKSKYTTHNVTQSNVLPDDIQNKRNLHAMGHYLAGLIEGDGYIGVYNSNPKIKAYRPKILIVFNINDKPLAEKLSSMLNVGKVLDKSNAGHVLLQILAKQEVLNIINLINGKMRTPKIEALHRAISYINTIDQTSIPLLGIDDSSIDSNSWLSGFSDADANFSITISNVKNSQKTLQTRVQTFFRIEVRQNYTKASCNQSFFEIMTEICEFFTVNLYSRTRTKENQKYYSFMAIAHNSTSHVIVRNYFDRFPLLSSKYLAYKDWCIVQDLTKQKLTKENLHKINAIKNQFNSKRIIYDFSHVDKLTY